MTQEEFLLTITLLREMFKVFIFVFGVHRDTFFTRLSENKKIINYTTKTGIVSARNIATPHVTLILQNDKCLFSCREVGLHEKWSC